MGRMDLFRQHLKEKRAVKIIAGIDNFDIESIKKVVTAANQAGVSAIDICADTKIISQVKEMTKLPVFVSSIIPKELAQAIESGADAIELGNFDALYKNGTRMGVNEVLDLVRETLSLIDKTQTFFCVTIPGHVSVSEQVALAVKLESLGIDLIQTEGAVIAQAKSEGARGLLEVASVSIANTIEITRNVDIPVMTASGITSTTAPMALAAGASAIGVGSCINKLNSQIAMIAQAKNLVESVNSSQREKVLV
ncbi:MAG TPA: DUF561 domain-containing protein [Candidatus Gastranaerophilaceae bacterium]|nr:DUF561 domain-containing protein [Candidatus Gastranaerophilaceae bacterium]HPT41350.1 DUF561 domain-containing protein [Candidatus Gastranaerophilaceae bacterium]